MEETLVCRIPARELANSSNVPWQRRRAVAELAEEVARLRRENAEARQQAGYWRAQHARAVRRAQELEAEFEQLHARTVRRVQELEAEVEQLRGEIRKLQDQLYGRKSEKSSRQDRSNHLEGAEDDYRTGDAPRKRGQRAGRPGPRRRDYGHLPAVEDPRELPECARVCPRCGAALSPSDSEDSEQIELEVRPYRRIIRRRRYRRTCRCSNVPRTVTAPPGPKLIPKGLFGVSVWVEILIDKFHSHRPTERLLAQWELLGLDIAAGTVTGGLERLEPLFLPLYDALLTRNALSRYGQGDETRWMVFDDLEGKTGHRWWLWVFLGEDTVVYRLDPSRSHEVPEGHFPTDTSRPIVLSVDRYSAYKVMAQVKAGTVRLAFCWAHVRRDFVKVGKGCSEHKEWALAWLKGIRELYRQHHQRRIAQAGSPEYTSAETGLRATVAAMQTQTETELADSKLATPCRKVLTSLQDHWDGLTLCVDDPSIPLDNNASERQLRGPAVGRKNYYGSGALWSGRLAAMLFSVFATLNLCKLNVRKWLTWFLQSCAENGGRVPPEIKPFLPWNMEPEKRRELALNPEPDLNDSS
jgi:transposase